MNYRYSAYNLNISTTFPCNDLMTASDETLPDVEVIEGIVPEHLSDPQIETSKYEASPGKFLWNGGSKSGRFLVKDGSLVILERNPKSDDAVLARYFTTQILSAVLRQRGYLVLRGSAIASRDGIIVVCDPTRTTKSIFASNTKSNNSTANNQLTALALDYHGDIVVLPGRSQINEQNNIADSISTQYSWLHIQDFDYDPQSLPLPLRSLYIIEPFYGDKANTRLMKGTERFTAIQNCVYGPLFPGEHTNPLIMFITLVEVFPVYHLYLPISKPNVDEVMKMVVNG